MVLEIYDTMDNKFSRRWVAENRFPMAVHRHTNTHTQSGKRNGEFLVLLNVFLFAEGSRCVMELSNRMCVCVSM